MPFCKNILHRCKDRENIIDLLRVFGFVYCDERKYCLILSHSDFKTEHELYFTAGDFITESEIIGWATRNSKSAKKLAIINNSL